MILIQKHLKKVNEHLQDKNGILKALNNEISENNAHLKEKLQLVSTSTSTARSYAQIT